MVVPGFLPRLIGLAKAKELYYTADRVTADEATRLGLVNKVFADVTFRQDAFDYAKKLANGPTQALGRMKKNLNAGLDQRFDGQSCFRSATHDRQRWHRRVPGSHSRLHGKTTTPV